MSKKNSKNVRNALKQSTLTAFVSSKSNEISSGIRRNHRIILNMLVNVNLKSRIGLKGAKTIYFVSATPETQSSSITSEACSSTSAAVAIILK